ncbi:MAG: hypothetical protein ABIB04_05235 [Patescibacteria group bacterium]
MFGELTETERLFIQPEKHPWDALADMIDFMQARAGIRRSADVQMPTEIWPEGLATFNERDDDFNSPARGLTIERRVHVKGGEGLRSDQTVYIRGPVILGKDVKLRQGAVIIGPAYIGDGVTIGQHCRVKRSIIRRGTEIEFSTSVCHCVLGRNVFVEANSVMGDKLLEDKEVTFLLIDGKAIETFMSRLGLMAGDESRIGGGSVFVPGVLLPPRTNILPGTRIIRSGEVSSPSFPDPSRFVG